MKYLGFHLILINVLSALFMLVDKRKAIKGRWRIPERRLLCLCALGGSLGGLLVMQIFRHKTKHIRFRLGIPVMLVIHLAGLILLMVRR